MAGYRRRRQRNTDKREPGICRCSLDLCAAVLAGFRCRRSRLCPLPEELCLRPASRRVVRLSFRADIAAGREVVPHGRAEPCAKFARTHHFSFSLFRNQVDASSSRRHRARHPGGGYPEVEFARRTPTHEAQEGESASSHDANRHFAVRRPCARKLRDGGWRPARVCPSDRMGRTA